MNDWLSSVFDSVPSIIFLFEIFINLNTAYYYEGLVHTSRKKIIIHYLNTDFLIDFILVAPYLINQVIFIPEI